MMFGPSVVFMGLDFLMEVLVTDRGVYTALHCPWYCCTPEFVVVRCRLLAACVGIGFIRQMCCSVVLWMPLLWAYQVARVVFRAVQQLVRRSTITGLPHEGSRHGLRRLHGLTLSTAFS